MRVNLNHLHKIINRKHSEIRSISNGVSNNESLTVTSNTKQTQFDSFLNSVAEKKNILIEKYNNISSEISEFKRLKSLLNKMNVETGIDVLMIESSFIMKEVDFKRSFISQLRCSPYGTKNLFVQDDVNLEDIISTFTETTKTCCFTKQAISDKDIEMLETEIENLMTKKLAIDDKIAELNQTTFVEI